MADSITRKVFLLLLIVSAVNSIPLIAQFAVDQAFSLAFDILTDGLTYNDNGAKFEEINQALDIVDEKINQALALSEEIKEQGVVNIATEIELDLNVFISRFKKLVKTLLDQRNDGGNSTEKISHYQKNAEQFKEDTTEIPHLLKKLHDLIVGSSKVSAGRSAGLACDYTAHVFRQLESKGPHSEDNNFNMVLKLFHDYRDSLMTIQVVSFQIRNASCSPKDLLCKSDAEELEEHLQQQYHRFQECIPELVKNFTNSLSNVTILHSTTNQILYNLQYSSLVVDALVDWDRITSPQPQGLTCPPENSSISWSFVNATSSPGQNDFYLRGENDCILGFDQKFIHYTLDFPTFWTSGDTINRNEFLICSISASAYKDSARFRILPVGSGQSTRYQLKEIKTGKYLNVRVKKTNILMEINKRLIVSLLLNELKTDTWIITKPGSLMAKCKDHTVSMPDESDEMLIVFICVGVGIFLIIVFAFGICCYKKRKHQI